MMEDLAMQILEIIMNSIAAHASRIGITIEENKKENRLFFEVKDNGKGMTSEEVQACTNPFHTSRSTRSVGLGLSFLQGLCDQCGGQLKLESEVGKGTTVQVTLPYKHLDRPPLGNIGEMMAFTVQAMPQDEVELNYSNQNHSMTFQTQTIREALSVQDLSEPTILVWIRDSINEQITQLQGGENEESR